MKANAVARNAYVQAEVTTALAHQIRSIRCQRGWSQSDLAKRLGTTQAAVSRLEDPSYGRFTLKTLLDLSRVFDTGLNVAFVSFVTMLHETYLPKLEVRQVPSFDEEAPSVCFYSEKRGAQIRYDFGLPADEVGGDALISLDVRQIVAKSIWITDQILGTPQVSASAPRTISLTETFDR
jgi:transcriptional regulator with XRE-family HTH domain